MDLISESNGIFEGGKQKKKRQQKRPLAHQSNTTISDKSKSLKSNAHVSDRISDMGDANVSNLVSPKVNYKRPTTSDKLEKVLHLLNSNAITTI